MRYRMNFVTEEMARKACYWMFFYIIRVEWNLLERSSLAINFNEEIKNVLSVDERRARNSDIYDFNYHNLQYTCTVYFSNAKKYFFNAEQKYMYISQRIRLISLSPGLRTYLISLFSTLKLKILHRISQFFRVFSHETEQIFHMIEKWFKSLIPLWISLNTQNFSLERTRCIQKRKIDKNRINS